MSSHRFLFVRDHDDFFNWSACIVALNLTTDILSEYMEENAVECVGGLPDDDKCHILDFIDHNRSYYCNSDEKICMMEDLKCSCMPCKSLYRRIQQDLLGSPPCPKSSVLLEPRQHVINERPWWILLKMTLNHVGKKIPTIQDCDLKQLGRIVQRCSLFESIAENMDKVIATRNELMHSSSDELSTETKRSHLSVLEEFLTASTLKDRPKVRNAKYKIESMKSNNSRFYSKHEDWDELRRSIEGQMKAVENDIEEFNSKNLNVPELETIMKLIKDNKVTVEESKRLEERKEATLYEAVAIGRQNGAQALNAGGFVGEAIGSVAGGAGAWAAGKFKKLTQ